MSDPSICNISAFAHIELTEIRIFNFHITFWEIPISKILIVVPTLPVRERKHNWKWNWDMFRNALKCTKSTKKYQKVTECTKKSIRKYDRVAKSPNWNPEKRKSRETENLINWKAEKTEKLKSGETEKLKKG